MIMIPQTNGTITMIPTPPPHPHSSSTHEAINAIPISECWWIILLVIGAGIVATALLCFIFALITNILDR